MPNVPDVQITFMVPVDIWQNTPGGSFETPVGKGHPPLIYNVNGVAQPSNGNASPPQYEFSGDHQVPVGRNQNVMITLEDYSRRPQICIAPVRFLAHTWKGQTVTLNQMNGQDDQHPNPIEPVTFDVGHPTLHEFKYIDVMPPSWVNNTDDSAFNWNGTNASKDVTIKTPREYVPHLSFITSDLPGVLVYGLQCRIVKEGTDLGYYWFDPAIAIQ